MKIELDFPPADLFPNRSAGKHWGAVYATKSAYKEKCWWATAAQAEPLHNPKAIKLTLTYMMPDGRHRDVDNLLAASKAGLDAMAQVLTVNDKIFEPITVHRVYKCKPAKIVIDLEVSYE
jgi:Holliday junction resolvase RusA-like endonuclease